MDIRKHCVRCFKRFRKQIGEAVTGRVRFATGAVISKTIHRIVMYNLESADRLCFSVKLGRFMSGQSKADEYRQRAAACQRQADGINDPCLKRQIAEVAERWLALAQQAERISQVVHTEHDDMSNQTPHQDARTCPQCSGTMKIVRNVPKEGKLLELLTLRCSACDHVVTIEVEG
jgi:hypothetical protein